MTHNGIQIMKLNNQDACLNLGLPTHFSSSSNPANNVPHVYYSNYNHGPPGYGYPSSDLKMYTCLDNTFSKNDVSIN
jgi:hypothetical protein